MARRRAATDLRSPLSTSSEIAALYGVPLPEFARARNTLAARLGKAGQRDEGEAVKRLKKPTPPLWAINQVARRDMAAIGKLIDAVERLRAAQERQRSDEIDEAVRDERTAFGRVVASVRHQLVEAGFRDSPEMTSRAAGTLRGAAADPTRQEDLRQGTLKEELRAPGFEILAGGAPPADLVERVETPVQRRRRDESAEDRRKRERLERVQDALRVAESEAEDWRRRAGMLDGAVSERRERIEEAKKSVQELRHRLAEAEKRLADEQRAAEQVERESERARRDTERAEARLTAAARAVRAARAGR